MLNPEEFKLDHRMRMLEDSFGMSEEEYRAVYKKVISEFEKHDLTSECLENLVHFYKDDLRKIIISAYMIGCINEKSSSFKAHHISGPLGGLLGALIRGHIKGQGHGMDEKDVNIDFLKDMGIRKSEDKSEDKTNDKDDKNTGDGDKK